MPKQCTAVDITEDWSLNHNLKHNIKREGERKKTIT